MGRWLNRVHAGEENTGMPVCLTDRTDGTCDETVLSVSSVSQKRNPSFSFSAGDQPTATDRNAFEERAAILEYDEGVLRPEAERLAAEQMATILQFRREA